MHSVWTTRGMKCPQPKKPARTFRPLERGNRGKREVENRFGRLVTGWVRRHRGLGRGPKIISASPRYATASVSLACNPDLRLETERRFSPTLHIFTLLQ